MNSKIKALIASVRGFKSEAEILAIEVTKNHQPRIIELNTQQLEDMGIDSDGGNIVPKYAQSTVKRKTRLGQITSHVTLKDKGDFHGSFQVIYDQDSFSIVSRDEKATFLLKRYGSAVLGLTAENIGNLSQIIKPDYITLFYKYILG